MTIFPCPSPLRPARIFPAPQRWWGRDGFKLFRPTPSLPSPSPPSPTVIGVIIVNCHTLKHYYLNKHINISLFYSTQCDSLHLFCYVLYYEVFLFYFYFFNDCLVKHLDILFNFFFEN